LSSIDPPPGERAGSAAVLKCGGLEFGAALLVQSERYLFWFNYGAWSRPLVRQTNDVVLQEFFPQSKRCGSVNRAVILGKGGKAHTLSGAEKYFLSFKNRRQADRPRSENHPLRVHKLS
jgi:hypothetical protein